MARRDISKFPLYTEAEVLRLLRHVHVELLVRCGQIIADDSSLPALRSEAMRSVVSLTAALAKSGAHDAPTAWAGTPADAVDGAVDILRRLSPEAKSEAAKSAGLLQF